MACLTRRNPLPSKVSHDPTQLMALRQTVSMEQYISVTPGAYHIQRGKNIQQCNPRVACSLYITVPSSCLYTIKSLWDQEKLTLLNMHLNLHFGPLVFGVEQSW